MVWVQCRLSFPPAALPPRRSHFVPNERPPRGVSVWMSPRNGLVSLTGRRLIEANQRLTSRTWTSAHGHPGPW